MKVVFLGTITREQGGVYQYVQTLADSLCRFSKHDIYIVKDSTDDLLKDFNGKSVINVDRSARGLFVKFKKLLVILLPQLRKYLYTDSFYNKIHDLAPQLVINPAIMLAPLYLGYPYIVTIHDLQHKYYPNFFSIKERWARNFIYKKVARNSALVVCESIAVRDDVVKFLGVSPSKICVIPSPPPLYMTHVHIDPKMISLIKKKYDLPERFLFYPAQFWPHKNHVGLIQAIKIVENSFGVRLNLVLVGSKKDYFDDVMREISKLNLGLQVKYLGYVPQEDMAYLYKMSSALVLPTFFESLSIPIWEAFHLGVPVVCSNVCALPEQVGDAALLFNPKNIEEMAKQIYHIWEDETLRRSLIQKGYNKIEGLSSENYARQWQEIINTAIKG